MIGSEEDATLVQEEPCAPYSEVTAIAVRADEKDREDGLGDLGDGISVHVDRRGSSVGGPVGTRGDPRSAGFGRGPSAVPLRARAQASTTAWPSRGPLRARPPSAPARGTPVHASLPRPDRTPCRARSNAAG